MPSVLSSAAQLSSNPPPSLPVLTIWGTKDLTAVPSAISNARKYIKDLQDVALEDKGHWVLVEAKNEVTEKVLSWLKGLASQPRL